RLHEVLRRPWPGPRLRHLQREVRQPRRTAQLGGARQGAWRTRRHRRQQRADEGAHTAALRVSEVAEVRRRARRRESGRELHMRQLKGLLGVLAVLAVLGISGGARVSAQTPCDRACLKTMLDQYLSAVIKHDPKAAPLAVGFRQTENAINVGPGGGTWKSVTGLGRMQRRYLDASGGQAGYYGLVEEGAAVAVATVRVR